LTGITNHWTLQYGSFAQGRNTKETSYNSDIDSVIEYYFWNILGRQGGNISLRHHYCTLKACWVRSIDVKDREIGVFKTLINKGFPDIWFSSRLLCRRRQCKETLIFIVCGNISTVAKINSWVTRLDTPLFYRGLRMQDGFITAYYLICQHFFGHIFTEQFI